MVLAGFDSQLKKSYRFDFRPTRRLPAPLCNEHAKATLEKRRMER
jgi:hypothetical protein